MASGERTMNMFLPTVPDILVTPQSRLSVTFSTSQSRQYFRLDVRLPLTRCSIDNFPWIANVLSHAARLPFLPSRCANESPTQLIGLLTDVVDGRGQA